MPILRTYEVTVTSMMVVRADNVQDAGDIAIRHFKNPEVTSNDVPSGLAGAAYVSEHTRMDSLQVEVVR